MTCAKRQVTCTITDVNVNSVIGRNDCDNPQPVCPREPGEGYEKCQTICQQPGHAEVMAVRKAEELGMNLKGAKAVLSGIQWICNHCRQVTEHAGIVRIYVDTK